MSKVYRDGRPRKRGGFRPWVVDYVGLDGKRHREKTPATTKEEALAILRRRLSEIAKAEISGVHSIAALRVCTFGDFVKTEYLPHCEATHTPSTYHSDKSLATIAAGYFGKMTLRSITPGDIQRFIDVSAGGRTRHGKPLRPATVNRRWLFVSGVLAEACRRGYIDRNPARGIEQLPEHNDKLRWLTDREEDRLLAFLPEYLRPAVLTALHTGMRRGEVLGLKWADIDFEQRMIRATQTKNHRTRYIPINDKLDDVLRALSPYVGSEGPCPYVFVNPETGSGYRNVADSFRSACRKAGITGVTFHTLRHTFASRLAQAGVPLNTIRELLGHGDMTVTMRYAHLAPNNLREAVGVLAGARITPQVGTNPAQKATLKVVGS